ncbi:MAG: ribosome maturation factor RimM [Terriglobia bacterium]
MGRGGETAPCSETREDQSARLSSDPPQFLAVARILKPQGRKGEVAAEMMTDFPHRFGRLPVVYLRDSGSAPVAYTLERVWPHKGRIVLKFAGIDSIEQAERLRSFHVVVPYAERVRLPENSYYWSELIGCQVIAGSAEEPTEVGTVASVEPTAGVPLLHVTRNRAETGEMLIPLAQDICKLIDPAKKIILIDPPEDLLELNDF